MSHQTLGYLYLLTSVLAFSALGVSYKLGDRLNCSKRQVNLFLCLTGGLTILAWGWRTGNLAVVPPAMTIGAAAGVVSFFSVVAFRQAVARGRISTSWAALALSLAIPVVASIVFWRERPEPRHCLGLLLTVAAIALIGIDMGRTRQ